MYFKCIFAKILLLTPYCSKLLLIFYYFLFLFSLSSQISHSLLFLKFLSVTLSLSATISSPHTPSSHHFHQLDPHIVRLLNLETQIDPHLSLWFSAVVWSLIGFCFFFFFFVFPIVVSNGGAKGGQRGHLPPWLHLKFPCICNCNLKRLCHRKKKGKTNSKWLKLESESDTRKRK